MNNCERKIWLPLSIKFAYNKEQSLFQAFCTKQGKPQKALYLEAFENYILKLKRKEKAYQPTGILYLTSEVTFDTLFKNKNELIGLKLCSLNIHYAIEAQETTLLKLLCFLSQRINQIGFNEYFKVYKKIGQGNYATVFGAKRKFDGSKVAVKVFTKSQSPKEKVNFVSLNIKQAATLLEMQIMRNLDHPNILKLQGVYEDKNSIFFILDFIKGGSLLEYINNHQELNQNDIASIMSQLLQGNKERNNFLKLGLDHMHQKGIMHRDLKLENILLKKYKSVSKIVIADFGLATRINDKPFLFSRCGTPGYVAPEVINMIDPNATYSSVCDIYSTGAIFYFLQNLLFQFILRLTGVPLFESQSYEEVVKLNRQAKVDFSKKIFHKVPNDAMDLLKQMLQYDPEKRITAKLALQHEYIQNFIKSKSKKFDKIDVKLSSKLNNEQQQYYLFNQLQQIIKSRIQKPFSKEIFNQFQQKSLKQYLKKIRLNCKGFKF